MDGSGGAGAKSVRSRTSEPMDTAAHGSVNIAKGRLTRWGDGRRYSRRRFSKVATGGLIRQCDYKHQRWREEPSFPMMSQVGWESLRAKVPPCCVSTTSDFPSSPDGSNSLQLIGQGEELRRGWLPCFGLACTSSELILSNATQTSSFSLTYFETVKILKTRKEEGRRSKMSALFLKNSVYY